MFCILLAGCGPSANEPAITTDSAQDSAPSPGPRIADAAPRRVRLADELHALPDHGVVEVGGIVCRGSYVLEQIACSPGTREHESLIVIEVKPSLIHSALLMAGFESGTPGSFITEEDRVVAVPPTGDPIAIDVQWTDEAGAVHRQPIGKWMRNADPDAPLGDFEWVFAGSRFVAPPKGMGPDEIYVADLSGSVIGLVTFGDEMIACREVISDQAEVRQATHDPEMIVNIDVVPPVGTPVTVVLHRPESRP